MMNKHESTPLPQNLPTDGKKKPHRHKAKRVIKIALAVFFGIIMLSILEDFFVAQQLVGESLGGDFFPAHLLYAVFLFENLRLK